MDQFQQNPIPPQVKLPQQSKRLSPKVLTLVLVILAVLGIVALYWSKTEPQPITQTQDETADWKTYRNEEYGFELKYPSESIIVSESNVSSVDPPDTLAVVNFFKIPHGSDRDGAVFIKSKSSNNQSRNIEVNDIVWEKAAGNWGSISYSTGHDNLTFEFVGSTDLEQEKILSTFKFIE